MNAIPPLQYDKFGRTQDTPESYVGVINLRSFRSTDETLFTLCVLVFNSTTDWQVWSDDVCIYQSHDWYETTKFWEAMEDLWMPESY